ncbi:MAG: VWA domain-containing protein, partial [Chloroflexi bacterium]|nr:VWA domain-containing protein [Chloroflexota bacterium]
YPLDQKDVVTLAELQENPLRLESLIQQMMDEDGSVYDELVQTTVWVDPVANGETPMCAALRRAREIAERWVADHPDNFPPLVITVTDGMSSDGDPTEEAKALRRVCTSDGELLLFNCHITERSDTPVEFVSSEDDIPDDQYARLLFALSSPIPDSLRNEFFHATRQKLGPGTRGYIFNGDAVSVRKMLKFGSTIGRTPFVAAERTN